MSLSLVRPLISEASQLSARARIKGPKEKGEKGIKDKGKRGKGRKEKRGKG